MNAKEIGKLIQDNKPELKLLDDGSYQLDFTITMKAIETTLQQEAKALMVECYDCGGSGGIASHHWQCDGNCGPECPVLEPCERCQGTGGISALPPESERIRELERSLQFVNATLEARASDIARLYKQNDALESKIAMVISYCNLSSRHHPLNYERIIEILEAKNE